MGLGYNPNSQDGRGGRAERRAGGEEGEQGAGEVLGQVGRQVQEQEQVQVQLISCVCQSLYFTSQSRKDRVVMKDVMLGRSSCRPEGDTDQTVQKLGWGRVMVLISILACLATARTSLATTSCPVPVRAA